MIDTKQRWMELVLALVAFGGVVAGVSFLWRNNLVLTMLMLVEFALVLRLWHDRSDLSLLLVIGGMGSLAEAVFVRSGAWHYSNPSFLGVPLWFPVAFGTSGLVGGRLARSIAHIWEDASSRQTSSRRSS
jgi:hypothetical protein